MRTLLLAALVAGCATTGTGTKSAQRYTGYPYDITDDGSRISGLVCGVNVDYSVARRGDATVVSGFGSRSSYVEVRDDGGARHVTGTLGGSVASDQLDLVVAGDRVQGRAGLRDVDLVAQGDAYRGKYMVRNQPGAAPMQIEGRAELMKLPPAEVGALMPAMMNCGGAVGKPVVWGETSVRFGGAPGYETRAANELR
jgi:hypothetical protein